MLNEKNKVNLNNLPDKKIKVIELTGISDLQPHCKDCTIVFKFMIRHKEDNYYSLC